LGSRPSDGDGIWATVGVFADMMVNVGIDVTVDEAASLVIVRWTGTIAFEDFQRARAKVTATVHWSADFTHVLDFTNVVALDLSTQDIQMLASAQPIFASGVMQILVVGGPLEFGLSRMFQTYADGKRDVHVVRSLAHALELATKR
jgi:hypothetical protein